MDNKVAGGAVKCAMRQLNIDILSTEDWEDLHQEASIALWKTAGRFDDPEQSRKYSFGAAIREVKKAYFSQIIGRGPQKVVEIIGEIETEESPEKRDELSLEIINVLSEVFIATRIQKKGRALDAAFRDVAICALLYAGYNNTGISKELGIPEANVRRYRSKIREVLRSKLEESE